MSIGERPEELRATLSGQAHVWISDLEVWDRKTLDSLLPADELTRARTLRHPAAQQNYLAGRALIRVVLSHYTDRNPPTWNFTPGHFGRPEITGPQPVPELRFNLTHTPGLAACVVTATADCGIDVETTERPLKPLRIAEHSFAPEEFHDLEARPSGEIKERFFSYWTLKEAYYKARGSGIPFRLFGARFELSGENSLVFSPAASEQVSAEEWQFELFRPTTNHILAVALSSSAKRRLETRCFSNSPDAGATDFGQLKLVATRSSETTVV